MVGPLFRVEMVATARQRRFFALRVIYGGLILFAMWSAFETASGFNRGLGGQSTSIQESAARANAFFVAYTWLQTFAILAVAPAIAAGTVASERERRTIEYLFVTDLSNREIILDKLLAKLAVVAKFVALGLPILFLFRLMGGIAGDMLLGSFVAAASMAVMLTGLGLFVSVCSQKPRDAIVRVYLLLGVLMVLPALVTALFAGLRQMGYGGVLLNAAETVNGLFVAINPFVLAGATTGTVMVSNVGFQWEVLAYSAGGQLLVGIAAIAAAAALVRRVHLKETTRSAKEAGREKKSRKWGWQPAMGSRPMLWKEMYSGTSQTKLGFMGRIAAALLIIGLFGSTIWVFIEAVSQVNFGGRNASDGFLQYLLVMTGFVGSAILLMLGSRASGLVTLEKERDCWLSLIATPLTGKEIVQGKVLGNMYAARWMYAILAACWAFGVAIEPAWLLVILANSAVLVILSWYVSQVGVGYSLRSSTTLRSMLITVGTLMIAGGGYLFCCCAVAAGGAGGEEMILGLCACIPMLLVYPGMAYQRFVQDWGGGDDFAYFSLAFGLGVFGYFAAGATIGLNNQREFDKIAGRVSGRPARYQEPVVASAGGPATGPVDDPPGM